MRLLRLQPPQRHSARDPHPGADRGGVPGDPRAGAVREPAARDGREPAGRGRRLHRAGAAHVPPVVQQPHHRGDAPGGRGVRTAHPRGSERRGLLPGDLQPQELQPLPPGGHEVEVRVARERLRPHGAGRGAQDRHGRADRAGGVAHRRHDDGPAPAIPAQALLEDALQRQLPAHAPLGGALPAQRRDERPRARAADLRLPHLRPRRRHLLLDARAARFPQPHRHAGGHVDERRVEDRPGRLLHLSAVARAVRRERRAHPYEVVWKDWDKVFD